MAWRERSLAFTNYRTRVSVSADPEAIRILNFFEDWAPPSDIFGFLPEYSQRSLRQAVRLLLKNTLLVSEGTRAAAEDEKLVQAWSHWLPDGSFHFSTKDVTFIQLSQTTRLLKRYIAESPQPELLKSYPDATQIDLPKVTAQYDGEFARVLLARKTHRDFMRQNVTLDAVSRLLFYTWGVHGMVEAGTLGRLFHKTSPSGGARHSIEVYLLAIRVEGLSQGLYHYNGVDHRLSRLRSVRAEKKAAEYTAGQGFLRDASALFIMTSVFPRVQWKYRFARAYRVVLLDAGHLCQTFCLVATWLGLAPFCTAALKDSLIERDLGIDGIHESALYVAGVGVMPDESTRKRR